MKPFDNYEISPCRRYEEPDAPGTFFFEVCDPEEADVWTLYGHIPGEGAEAIGDFATRKHAEETFQRITGIPFGGYDAIAARLRVMHAGPTLLPALIDMRDDWLTAFEIDVNEGDPDAVKIISNAETAIARATDGDPGSWPPIIIEVLGGVVQDVRNVPPGFEYELLDHDSTEE